MPYIGKWIKEGAAIGEETKATQTAPESVVSYMLEGDGISKGEYTFELHDGGKVIFTKTFIVE